MSIFSLNIISQDKFQAKVRLRGVLVRVIALVPASLEVKDCTNIILMLKIC